jgi:hypothetical protein
MTTRSLANKLQLEPGSTLAVLGVPPGYRQPLGRLPERVHLTRSLRVKADIVQPFFRTRGTLLATVPGLKRGLTDGGILRILPSQAHRRGRW